MMAMTYLRGANLIVEYDKGRYTLLLALRKSCKRLNQQNTKTVKTVIKAMTYLRAVKVIVE